jgi:hypothetical protein
MILADWLIEPLRRVKDDTQAIGFRHHMRIVADQDTAAVSALIGIGMARPMLSAHGVAITVRGIQALQATPP